MSGIAISGKAGAGKSAIAREVARQLKEQRGLDSKILSYAAPLKLMCEQEWGITKEMPGGREALERFGDEKRAECGADYFVKLLAVAVGELEKQGLVPIIDDLRLSDEYEHLTQLGFVRVRVAAPMSVRYDRLVARGDNPEIAFSENRYETELDGYEFDATVFNVGPLADIVSASVLHLL